MDNDKRRPPMSDTTKIKSVTVICQQGIREYEIGDIVNGLLLHEIKDETLCYRESCIPIYRGVTACGETVFHTVNAPTDAVYMPIDTQRTAAATDGDNEGGEE